MSKIYLAAGWNKEDEIQQCEVVLPGYGHTLSICTQPKIQDFFADEIDIIKESDLIIVFSDFDENQDWSLILLGAIVALGKRCLWFGTVPVDSNFPNIKQCNYIGAYSLTYQLQILVQYL